MARQEGAQVTRLTAAQRQDVTRTAVIDSAIQVFSDQGYYRASLEEISRRAGYSTGAVYSNFSGKEGLFFACLDRVAASQAEQWEHFFSGVEHRGYGRDDLEAVLRAVIPDRSWRRAVVEFTVLPKTPESAARLIEVQRGWRAVVRRLIVAMINSSTTTRLGDDSGAHQQQLTISPDDAAEIVAAVVDGLMIAGQVDPDLAVERLAATTIQLISGLLTDQRGRASDGAQRASPP